MILAINFRVCFFSIFNFFSQMQPLAVRRFRVLSPVAIVFCALLGTSGILLVYKKVVQPWKVRRKFSKSEAFADEYFAKHNTSDEHEN